MSLNPLATICKVFVMPPFQCYQHHLSTPCPPPSNQPCSASQGLAKSAAPRPQVIASKCISFVVHAWAVCALERQTVPWTKGSPITLRFRFSKAASSCVCARTTCWNPQSPLDCESHDHHKWRKGIGCDGIFLQSPVCTAKKCPPAQNLEELAVPHPAKEAGSEAKYPLNARWDAVIRGNSILLQSSALEQSWVAPGCTYTPRNSSKRQNRADFELQIVTKLVTSPLVLPLASVCQGKLNSVDSHTLGPTTQCHDYHATSRMSGPISAGNVACTQCKLTIRGPDAKYCVCDMIYCNITIIQDCLIYAAFVKLLWSSYIMES